MGATIINSSYLDYEALIDSSFVLDNSKNFKEFIQSAREVLDQKLKDKEPIYGVNTGYGASGVHAIDADDAKTLQQNLYRFHGCGVGENLSKEIARSVIVCRMISLAKGKSGVSYALLDHMQLLLDKDIIPVIPSQGSVGASGDLTPLSYLGAVIAGEREVFYQNKIVKTALVYEKLGIKAYSFKPKEALSIMNGTSVMSAIALAALQSFETLFDWMLRFVGALYELLGCDVTPLHPYVHEAKPFYGQQEVAKRILALLEGSSTTLNTQKMAQQFYQKQDANIQDSYSIRCVPQVLGVVLDTLNRAKEYIAIEINSVNDNPLIDVANKQLYTSGNFYGGYVANAMDDLKVAAANMADLLDKEFALLVDGKFNRDLTENLKLSDKPYYHGFKAMQITLSSLCGDVLKNTQAASLYSRPTESLNQDKVSMGTTAALDFLKMQQDLANMLAIAHLGAAQGVDIKTKDTVSASLLALHTAIRKHSKPVDVDRRLDTDIAFVKDMIVKAKLPEDKTAATICL
ncbi:MAG: HAL/PAL/TAL family ammonia-lyase [Campylobacterota bacterium]